MATVKQRMRFAVGSLRVLGLPGAEGASIRLVGGTTASAGAPASGTFKVGDIALDVAGVFYACTVAGSPGTWVALSGGSANLAGVQTFTGAKTFSAAATFTGGVTVTTADVTITDRNIVLSATTGTKIGTATTQKLGFYGATPITCAVLATGAAHTADDVITALQNLGLVKQS